MFLKSLHIRNFRIYDDVTFFFKEGVNIIIGENNSGKTALIDALRLCLNCGHPDNDLFIRETDLHIIPDASTEQNSIIQFDLYFTLDENNEDEIECFYELISQDKDDIQKQIVSLHISYQLQGNKSRKYFKRTIWGGDKEGQSVPYEVLQELFCTYLSPLRDAVHSLRPYSYDNKISELFNKLTQYKKKGKVIPLDDDKKKELASNLYKNYTDDNNDWKAILDAGNEKVREHLEGTGIYNKHPDIKMEYVGRKFSDVVRGIELKCPVPNSGISYELFQNGLGENNLIYASVVLGDLINRCKDPDLELYNALLVEEPEAHLHPQYQNTFFKYLDTLKDSGLQVFITSHSPTIVAKSELNNITLLQRVNNTIRPFSFSALPAKDYPEESRRHLRKFLDTTKAQMFFASGIILVEGIAEAILLPLLSSKFLQIDLDKYGIEVVNVGGVSFSHFGKLFNNKDETKRLVSKCAIITDSDPDENGKKSTRAENIKSAEGYNLIVSLASHTLEYDLFQESAINNQIMRRTYRKMHSQTQDLCGDFTVDTLMDKLSQNKDKAEFALNLYDELDKETCDSFSVPEYITNAIHYVTNNNDHR